MEAIAKKLFGIETITDKSIKSRMINNAVKAGKNAAELVYGGFDMMRSHRENEQLKGQNAMLNREYNKICRNNMSIEAVRQMVQDFAESGYANYSYFSDEEKQADVNKFIEEWRKNNDCRRADERAIRIAGYCHLRRSI